MVEEIAQKGNSIALSLHRERGLFQSASGTVGSLGFGLGASKASGTRGSFGFGLGASKTRTWSARIDVAFRLGVAPSRAHVEITEIYNSGFIGRLVVLYLVLTTLDRYSNSKKTLVDSSRRTFSDNGTYSSNGTRAC